MKKRLSYIKRATALFLSTILTIAYLSNSGLVLADAAIMDVNYVDIEVNGGQKHTATVLFYSYENNSYISLRDVAFALKDTDKAFDFYVTNGSIRINTQKACTGVKPENAWPETFTASHTVNLKTNELKVDGEDRKYSTIISSDANGQYDAFFSLLDLSMILDIHMAFEDDVIKADTEVAFDITPEMLEEEGFFEGVNAALVGNATTGEIWYGYNSDLVYPIASTTKIMTYLLVMEAVSEGKFSLEDSATVSARAELLSRGGDSVVGLTQGQQIPVKDLLYGMLIASSNESALVLAETVGGSEEKFADMMNEKASQIGMLDSKFYNSNGLPDYSEHFSSSKRQNYMTAQDMFVLCAYVLRAYPQITQITSTKNITPAYFGREIKNTNSLLHNIEQVTGLKTGTTNKAGYCLITSLKEDDNDLVVVMFGADNSTDRIRVSEVLSRYALRRFRYGATSEEEIHTAIDDADDIVRAVIRYAKSKS